MWVRGFLQDDYGVNPWDVEWVVAREEKLEGIPYDPRIQVTYRRPDDSNAVLDLDAALLRGEVDAVTNGSLPATWARASDA